MQKLKVALDYDSMLNNLGYVWAEWCRTKYDCPDFQMSDISHWDYQVDRFGLGVFDFINADAFDTLIKPLPGAAYFVRALEQALGEENVIIVTANVPGTEQAKLNNIKRHFGIDPNRVSLVSLRGNKAPFTAGAVLIDDYGKNILEHVETHQLPGIVFNYNREYPWSGMSHFCPDRVAAASDYVTTCHSYDEVLLALGVN
jgi:5'(3')-deoxyribonucleotidase